MGVHPLECNRDMKQTNWWLNTIVGLSSTVYESDYHLGSNLWELFETDQMIKRVREKCSLRVIAGQWPQGRCEADDQALLMLRPDPKAAVNQWS